MKPRLIVGIVAGEPSGDQLGAGLISAVRRRSDDIHFVGIGGEQMQQAGCEILYPMEEICVIGFDGLRDKLFAILRIRRYLAKYFIANKSAVFIGIDAPDFNLTLEAKLKRRGIPTIHYVSPTVWAWRGYRIHKIRRAVSHMLTLFPFEKKYYEEKQIAVTFVGHPFADQIGQPDRMAARKRLGIGPQTTIALLPGSRISEIQRHAELFSETIKKLHVYDPNIVFLLPFASQSIAHEFKHIVDLAKLPVITLKGQARCALEACNLAVLASGTIALEAALLQRTMVVVYKTSALASWLVRRLRHVDYVSMPNHLLDQPLVPEFIQEQARPDNIVIQVKDYLENPDKMCLLEQNLAQATHSLCQNASERAADVVFNLIQAKK